STSIMLLLYVAISYSCFSHLLPPVLAHRRAPTHKPRASVRQFEAKKILSRRECVHDRPLLSDQYQSFRLVVLAQRQFLRDSFQFVRPLRRRSPRADCTRGSSAPASHAPMLQAPSLANLHSVTAG